jgi:hypothetical protein
MIVTDKRKAVFLLHQEGMAVREIARRLALSRNTVRAIIRQSGTTPQPVLYSGELFRGGIRGMKCGATGQMIGLGRGDRGVVGCEDRVELEGDLFPELVTGDGEV